MSQPEIVIRNARPSDAERLASLAARTFCDTYAADNDPEDLALHLHRSFSVTQQVAELEDPDVRALLAEIDGQDVAFAQFRRGSTPPCVHGLNPREIWRFYVDRPWIGRGIAQSLMEAVRAEAVTLGGQTLWLGVWERNSRAISFYQKCGFEDVGSHVFQLGKTMQTDRVLVYSLDQGRASIKELTNDP